MRRTQIEYQTGRDPLVLGHGWLTIDGHDTALLNEGERRDWARGQVARWLNMAADQVVLLGVHCGTDEDLAIASWHSEYR